MTDTNIGDVIISSLEDEIQKSYLDYAVSAIGRTLPDGRDGFKLVQRRIIFAMLNLQNTYDKQHKKSARVVGDVIGKYHPHGDAAAYEALVRMAQDFSLRYPLIDGQGNFGSIDGDSAAAHRYTEVRMSKITNAVLKDINKGTVDFVPNYDNTEFAPSVMPTQFPNLLVNGCTGIAVGMATNIPPHNLYDVMQAVIAMIDNPEISLEELIDIIKGPDFPTGAIINGRAGIIHAYKTGRGKIYIKAKADIEVNGKQESIVVTEIPFMLNKSRLLEKIGWLVREKRIEGISTFRDESDREGMRVVVEVKRGENAEVVLNKLYSMTQLQSVFGINMVVLNKGQPECLGLLPLLKIFIDHRRDVVRRRVKFDLAKSKARAHILEGLGVALNNIDAVVEMVKKAPSPKEAKVSLMQASWQVEDGLIRLIEKAEGYTDTGLISSAKMYVLSETQAQAILDMRLHRLTGLEREKILGEYQELIKQMIDLIEILSQYHRLMAVIREESVQVAEQFKDDRRTSIVDSKVDIEDLDLIPNDSIVITLSHLGYLKLQELDSYKAQRRGGVGKQSVTTREEDYATHMYLANRHDHILCFSDHGRLYWLKGYQLPIASRTAKGRPIVNYLPLEDGEKITALMPVKEFSEELQVVMVTRQGVIKQVSLSSFSRPRASGIIAVNLDESDALIEVLLAGSEHDVMIFSKDSKAIRFSLSDVRVMGRSARGVRSMRLKSGDYIVSALIPDDARAVLTVSSEGFGKRTPLKDFRKTGRGGQGVLAMSLTPGAELISAADVGNEEDIFLITNAGTLVRISAASVSMIGRNTKGVKLVRLKPGENLVAAQVFASDAVDIEESDDE
ncbi:DNA gyrase subunit A [Gammaproteobacteria bacterium]|nr:DNA gyrase subunit A [Gammaproteobacteria bacterium]